MAKKKPQTVLEEDSLEAPSGQKSTDEARKGLSEREVFAGDEEFYEFMARQGQVQVTTDQSDKTRKSSKVGSLLQHFSILQKVLALGIIVAAVILMYALLRSFSRSTADTQMIPVKRRIISPESPINEDSSHVKAQQLQEPQFASSSGQPLSFSGQPLSLKVAQDFYLQKNYSMAYETYNQLQQGLPMSEENSLLRDFLQLKMALCMRKTGDSDQAQKLPRV